MGSRNGKRRAVVTGAAGGIGKAVAQRLLAEGVEVLAVDIDARPAGRRCCRRLRDIRRGPLRSRPARQRSSKLGAGYDYLVNSAGILQGQADPRSDGRGMADHPDGQRRVGLLPVPEHRRQAQSGRRHRQPVVELGEARDRRPTSRPTPRRRRRSCRSPAPSPTRWPIAPVRVNAICPGIVDTRDAGELPRQASPGSAASTAANWTRSARRPCRSDAAPAPEECAGADLVPAVRRGGLHDRPGDELHRRPGEVVRRTTWGGNHEETDDGPRDRPRPSRRSLRARRRPRDLRQHLCQRDRRLGSEDQQAGHLRLCRRRAERLHARHRRRRLLDPDAECRRLGRARASPAVDPEDAARRQGRDPGHRGRRQEIRRSERPHLRPRRPALLHRFRRLEPGRQAASRPHRRHREGRHRQDPRGTRLRLSERHRRRAGRLDRLGRILHAPRRAPHARRQEDASSTRCPTATSRTASRSTSTAISGSPRSPRAAST